MERHVTVLTHVFGLGQVVNKKAVGSEGEKDNDEEPPCPLLDSDGPGHLKQQMAE